jgi:lipopolysaccharide/colanic/teichoic acid biosynthesis glycosyltransferase
VLDPEVKSSLDIVASAIGLVALSPLLALFWLLVVSGSGRPGLFQQGRVGRGGRDFTLLKFRAMIVRRGAESGAFDAGSAARATGVGRHLRRSRLDELPQLMNSFPSRPPCFLTRRNSCPSGNASPGHYWIRCARN